MTAASMILEQSRVGFWLIVCGLGSIWAPPVSARQVIHIPAAEVIEKAEVVVIAVIEKLIEKQGECEDIRDYTLRPEQALKGKLTEAMKQVKHLQTDLKTGKDCMEVSYSVPPWTTTREVGAKVIAVIGYVDSLKEYRATATFNFSELDSIQKLIAGGKRAPDSIEAPKGR
jgi:hypothetical protein